MIAHRLTCSMRWARTTDIFLLPAASVAFLGSSPMAAKELESSASCSSSVAVMKKFFNQDQYFLIEMVDMFILSVG